MNKKTSWHTVIIALVCIAYAYINLLVSCFYPSILNEFSVVNWFALWLILGFILITIDESIREVKRSILEAQKTRNALLRKRGCINARRKWSGE